MARRRTVVVLALAALGSLGSLALLTYLTNRLATDAVEEQIGERVDAAAQVGADGIRSDLEGVRGLVESYAERHLVRRALSDRLPRAERSARLRTHLQGLRDAGPDIGAVYVLDPRARLLDARPPAPAMVGDDLSSRGYFREPLRGGRASISSTSGHADAGMVAASAVVRGAAGTRRAGRPVAVLVAAYRTRGIHTSAARAARELGVVLEVSEADAARPGRGGAREQREGGERVLAADATIGELGWTVSARVPARVAYAEVRDLRLTVLALAGLLGAVLLGVLLLVARLLRRDGDAARVLADRERASRAMIDASYAAFIATDGDGRIIDWNGQAEALFGWSRDEVAADPAPELIVPSADAPSFAQIVRGLMGDHRRATGGARVELLARHRSGRTFPVEAALWRSEADGHAVLHAFVHDISERKRTEDALGISRDDALAASRLKSEFLANMSHEIRTPMNGVIGMAELLLETDLGDRQREFAATIASSGDALLSIIDDILDFSKIEAGKLEIEASQFALVSLIADVCELLAPRADAKGVELTCHVAEDVPAFACGDQGRLRQVLTNLVGNAVKFTDTGEVAVTVSAAGAGDMIAVEVSDTGAGIDADQLDALFEPFTQADASMTRRHAGTGLGLTISRQLVELMGGTIGVASRRHVGSTFRVELPLPASAPVEAAPQSRVAGLAGARVLAVDDHATNRRIIDAHLRAGGADPVMTADGTEALAALDAAASSGRPFDVVVLDMKMPGLSGDAVARVMRMDPRHDRTPILLLSSTRIDVLPTDNLRPCASVRKPLRRARLLDAIGALLDDAAAQPVVAEPARSAPDPEAVSVLVVEDNVVNQEVVREMLESRGHRVELAGCGTEAIAAFEATPFDVVLMDCQMPDMDGYQVTAHLRAVEATLRRSTPIIAMTASSMAGDRERCIAAGMDDYLSKPFRRSELNAVLVRWSPAAPAGGRGATSAARPSGGRTRVLELFHADVPRRLVDLRDAARSGNTEALRRQAHALRGSSSMVGAGEVAAACARIESAGRSGELAGVDVTIAELGRAVADFRRATSETAPGAAAAGQLTHSRRG